MPPPRGQYTAARANRRGRTTRVRLYRSVVVEPWARASRSTIGVDGLVRFFVAVALVVVFPWLVITASPDGGRNTVWVLSLVIAAWSGLRLASIISAGVPRLFEFSFWLYCYLFMGLAAAAQIHSNDMAGTTSGLDPSQDLPTVIVIAVGIAAFEVGALIRRSTQVDAPPIDTSAVLVEGSASSVNRSLWLLAATAPVAIVFILMVGPANFFTNRTDFSDITNATLDSSVLPILRAISWIPALVVLHRIISRRRSQPGSKLNGPELLGVAVAGALILFANNPLTSSRYAFGSMVLSLAVLLGACATVQRSRRTMLLVIVGFVLVFPLADTFRRPEAREVTISVLDEYSGNPDYDSFGQISNAITVVGDEGFSYARQPLGVALFWVPRSVWQDKPVDTGAYLAEARGYRYTNLSAPLWSEFYLVGGYFAVFVGFAGLGYGLVVADRRLVQGLRGERPYSVAGAFMPFYLIILLRGSLLQAAALVAALGVSIWMTRPAPTGDPGRVVPVDDHGAVVTASRAGEGRGGRGQ